jgi:hypothetical protein
MVPHLELGLACLWLSWDYPGMNQIGHVAFIRYDHIEPVRLAARLVNARHHLVHHARLLAAIAGEK